MTAVLVMFRMLLRQQIAVGRFILAGAFTALFVILALTSSGSPSEELESTVLVVLGLGLNLMVPIITLVAATSALGDLVDDETLVYLWHRPTPRWKLALAAWLASVAMAAPLTILPLALTSLLSSGATAAVGAAASAALSVLAYSGLFVFLGLLLRRALIWGLLYLFIWEAVLSNFADGVATLSITTYPTSVLANITDVDVGLNPRSTAVSIIVSLVVAAVGVALTARRLDTMDIA